MSSSRASSASSIVFRLRWLFGRPHQLLGQCRVREPHQHHQLFSYSSALRASTLAFGSRSSSRDSFSLSIIPRLRLIGCHLQLLGVKNTLFLELHWRHRLSSSSARRASPSASGSKSSSQNSSTSMIVHRRRIIGCHPNHLCQVLFNVTRLRIFGRHPRIWYKFE